MATRKEKLQFVQLTQTLYANLQTIDQNTLYFCKDTNRIYLGSTLMSRPAQVVSSLPASGIENTVYIRTTDGTIHYYNGTNFVQCYNRKVDDTAIKSVTVSGGTLTTKDFDSNSSSTYINGLVSGVTYTGGKLQITITNNGATSIQEVDIPIENYLDSVERLEVKAEDVSNSSSNAAAITAAKAGIGDIGMMFTMKDGKKTFVKLTDFVNIYTVDASNSTSAVTVSIDGYKVNAALKYDNNHFEQDATTGALKIKASAVKAAVAVSGAVENNLAGLDANGNTKDSGYAAGGIELGNGSTTLATEAAVVTELAKKMNLTATGIAEGTVMVADGSRGVKSGAVTIGGTSTLGNSGTVLAVESAVKAYVDTEVGKKVTKQTSAVSGNVVKFATGGEVQDSGLTTGGATLNANPTATVLATEAAVKAYADGAAAAAQTAATNVANGKVAKQTSATENHVVIFGQGGEVKDAGYTINTTSNYLDSNSVSNNVLVTEATLAGIVLKVQAGEANIQQLLTGKLDKVDSGKADEIVTATATGTVQTSGKKVGGATLAASTNANTVATEAAVEAAIEDAVSWTIITE